MHFAQALAEAAALHARGDRCGVDGVDLAAEQPNRLQRRAHRRGVDRRGDPGGADLIEGDISLAGLSRRIVESRDVSSAEIPDTSGDVGLWNGLGPA